MNGIGIIVNILAVLVGGGFGFVCQGRMKARYQQIISQTVGLLLIGIGGYALVNTYFVIAGKEVEMEGIFRAVFAILCGLVLGMVLHMEEILNGWGKRLSAKTVMAQKADERRRQKLKADLQKAAAQGSPMPKISRLDRMDIYEIPTQRSGNLFVDGFVMATLMVCASPMLMSGMYEDSLNGDAKTLVIKSVIDLILCFALAFIYGGGVRYASIPLGVVGGFCTMLFLITNYIPESGIATFVLGLMTPTVMGQISLIGAVMTIGLGICLAFEKKLKIVNLLPASAFLLVYQAILMGLAEK